MPKPTKEQQAHLTHILEQAEPHTTAEEQQKLEHCLQISIDDPNVIEFNLQPKNFLRLVQGQLEFSDNREVWRVVKPLTFWPIIAGQLPSIPETAEPEAEPEVTEETAA